ncbi:hypothetical protein D9757_003696 [Collybiopsis confluens]|uniref:J domain-containing protein n=1 Tax=Collybiopsis confluens TaxID=2823264 RepID=A0A8H5MCX7_9AGAR|nr:hypothetical protein D9757_003696 [Collybiopsis confluens]
MSRAQTLANAYAILGLEEGVSLQVVKISYKQAALRAHPDKNPGNPDATAEFQRVGEAYSTILKHLNTSARAPRRFSGFGYSDDEDCHDDSEDDYAEEDLMFFMFMFDRELNGRTFSARGLSLRYLIFALALSLLASRPPNEGPPETSEDRAERIRRAREEQEAAEARRKQEASVRKEQRERARQQERAEAEERQKAKKGEKKAKAKVQRQQAQDSARARREKIQTNRSAVFRAARQGDAAQVKKAVWEDNVDAAGGEVKTGYEEFVKIMPKDPQETLLHIAARHGDSDLVQWLEEHGAEIEERDNENRTAFQVAVQNGHLKIITRYFENYPPKDLDHSQFYANALSLALQSHEPQVIWMILENGLATSKDINDGWSWITSAEGNQSIKRYSKGVAGNEKFDDILKLLMRYGGFTPPPTPELKRKSASHTVVVDAVGQGRGRGRGRD